jgi:hypothetical protein
MRWAGHAVRTGKKRNSYWILVGKPEGKRPFGRARRRCKRNIKIDLKNIMAACGLDLCGSG